MPELDAPDTAHSALVVDHHFVPPEGQPWARCIFYHEDKKRVCGLAESTHTLPAIEDTDPGRPPSMRFERPSETLEDQPNPFPVPEINMAVGQEFRGAGLGPVGEHEEFPVVHTHVVLDGKEIAKAVTKQELKKGDRVRVDRDETIRKEGHKDDSGKHAFFYLPWDALEDVARVMEYGAKKYAPGNYRKGMKWSRYFSAMVRHIKAWRGGEQNDPESGLPHLAHAACCVLMLMECQKIGTGEDDRY